MYARVSAQVPSTGTAQQSRVAGAVLALAPSRPVRSARRATQQHQRHQQQQPSAPRACSLVARAAPDTQGAPGATRSSEPVVDEIMNPHPVLLRANMPIKEAVHVMLDADVSGAPVVDEAGHLMGVLTEKDLIWKGAGAPEDHFIIPPVFIGFAEATVWLRDNHAFEEEAHKILAKTVAEAMAKERLVSVTPSTPMSEAARLMLKHDINLLPVQEAGRVVGVCTRHDVLRGLYASHSPFLE